MTLVLGAAAEELFPKVLGVGFPVLLAAVPFFATKTPIALPIVYALGSGAAEDALSSLPPLASASFFLLLAALVRWTPFRTLIFVFAYPVYQLWLSLWCAHVQGGIFGRVVMAFPLGVATCLAVFGLLSLVEDKAAAHEVG